MKGENQVLGGKNRRKGEDQGQGSENRVQGGKPAGEYFH
jgi:hypothetical protein